MITFLINHKKIFLALIVITSPIILLSIILYGFIIGFIGGLVWGYEKLKKALSLDVVKDELKVFLLKYIFMIIYLYVSAMICLLAAFVCLFIGPFRAYSNVKSFIKGIWTGEISSKKVVKPLVLVVDDEVEIAKNIAERIEQTGKYSTILAHNGREALQVLKNNERFLGIAENKVKCIILDIKMPEMNGLQFLQELRKQEGSLMFRDSGAFHQLPVIILSAYEDIEKITSATDPKIGKAVRYIVKPDRIRDLTELISTVDQVFDSKDRDLISQTYLRANQRINELRKE